MGIPKSLRCAALVVASGMLAGCATSQLHKDAAFIQPGVTTRTEVWNTLGPAHRVEQGDGFETLHYVQRERGPIKGAIGIGTTMGALGGVMILASSVAYPPALVLWPLAVAGCFAIGAVAGALVGTFSHFDYAKLKVEVGADGKVIKVKK